MDTEMTMMHMWRLVYQEACGELCVAYTTGTLEWAQRTRERIGYVDQRGDVLLAVDGV
jgi:hypothetical protein